MLAGECFCGAVRYAVADAFAYALNCHCSNCRRTTGSAFKPFAGIARDRLAVAKGGDNLLIYGDEAGHDAHCGRCGSLLYSVVRDGAFVHVAMGTLIDDPSIRPAARRGSPSPTTCPDMWDTSRNRHPTGKPDGNRRTGGGSGRLS